MSSPKCLQLATSRSNHQPERPGSPWRRSSSPFERAQVQAARATVLVAEESPTMRSRVADVLAREFRVFEARCAAEAFAICASPNARIRAVVTDLEFSGLCGPDFVAVLRHMQADLKVLYLAAYRAHDPRRAVGSSDPMASLPSALARLLHASAG